MAGVVAVYRFGKSWRELSRLMIDSAVSTHEQSYSATAAVECMRWTFSTASIVNSRHVWRRHWVLWGFYIIVVLLIGMQIFKLKARCLDVMMYATRRNAQLLGVTVKPRLHGTTCCQTGLTTGCRPTNIQPVVNRLYNRFDNRLYRVNGVGLQLPHAVNCGRFKLIRARDQTRHGLLCEFGPNPFTGSRDISYTNKKQTDGAKNRAVPLR